MHQRTVINMWGIEIAFESLFRHHSQSHCYADDCQIYVPLRKNDTVRPLFDCLDDIKASSFFKFQ